MQVFPASRAELSLTTNYFRGTGLISGFAYDGGEYTAQLVGLDFPLHSASMAGFSDLDISRLGLTLGANYRFTDHLVLNGMLDYGKYDDKEPYLFDATGKYLQFYGGVSWIF